MFRFCRAPQFAGVFVWLSAMKCVCMSVRMLEGVHACQIVFVTCPGAEPMLGLSDAGVLHQNQCFTKKRKVGIFIFSKRAAFFSLVNSLNKNI